MKFIRLLGRTLLIGATLAILVFSIGCTHVSTFSKDLGYSKEYPVATSPVENVGIDRKLPLPDLGATPSPSALLFQKGDLVNISFSGIPIPDMPALSPQVQEDSTITLPSNVILVAQGK